MNENQNNKSYFDGGYLGYIGYSLLVGFVTIITFGIALPWMLCLFQKWKCEHTVICGKRMTFDGTGLQLIGKYLLWSFLTLITFGIYGFWLSININKWLAKHTHFIGEDDNNSYFDGGVLGLLGTNILCCLVAFVPFVGFAWSSIIKTKWLKSHTVCDSRRLVFIGGIGSLFVKYLLWGFLTAITFGIYAWFVPVKELRWETENTIDNENTTEAHMKQSEFRTNLHTDAATFKTYRVENEMECVKSGINDAISQDDLLNLANAGNRAAQYEYVTRYSDGDCNAEPFAEFLKASADAGYSPAIDLYIQNFETDAETKGKMLKEAAQKGHTFALKEQMKNYAKLGLEADEKKNKDISDLLLAVRYSMLLEEDGIELSQDEKQLVKECIHKIRRILSAQRANKSSILAIVLCAVIVPIILALIIAVFTLFMPARMGSRPTIDDSFANQNEFSYVDDAAMVADFN
jgi:hypothetical protein